MAKLLIVREGERRIFRVGRIQGMESEEAFAQDVKADEKPWRDYNLLTATTTITDTECFGKVTTKLRPLGSVLF